MLEGFQLLTTNVRISIVFTEVRLDSGLTTEWDIINLGDAEAYPSVIPKLGRIRGRDGYLTFALKQLVRAYHERLITPSKMNL